MEERLENIIYWTFMVILMVSSIFWMAIMFSKLFFSNYSFVFFFFSAGTGLTGYMFFLVIIGIKIEKMYIIMDNSYVNRFYRLAGGSASLGILTICVIIGISTMKSNIFFTWLVVLIGFTIFALSTMFLSRIFYTK